MDARERYHALCDGGLYAFEQHERRFALPVVDDLLVPYARERLAGLRALIDGADSVDMADDPYLVAEFTYHYLRLRRELHRDLRHRAGGGEWLVVPQFTGGLGVRALGGAAVLVLRPAGGPRRWELIRRPGAGSSWTVHLAAEAGTNIGVIDAPDELERDEALFAHLLSGLAAVSRTIVRRRG
ncbi:hypothetical protein Dvina_15670 [Dactylosporangium vinaceum]|uniref:Uncharacterized protein n=1 Tax=Dactylosporangium vinaceum TaxID=53362 RepID=A0ABV5M211_9ACTN|nr:hypothetical protein [Dactylosporangium vinaceum]UAB99380.1 hypothetical protein Dvina_15670 [Dactylosporangium vinaceum]